MTARPLTTAEVAARLRVGRNFVCQEIARGHLRACRIGKGRGVYRVTQEQLQEYLERTTTGAPPWQNPADSQTATGRSALKTPAETSRELSALLVFLGGAVLGQVFG